MLSQSGFYPLVSGLLPPPLPPFYPMHCRCVDLGVCLPLSIRLSKGYSLPIRSNRISWKHKSSECRIPDYDSLPIRSNRISWKRLMRSKALYITISLPIRSNRISWKPSFPVSLERVAPPYLLGQIGLVGNLHNQ